LPDIDRRDASALLDISAARRASGLCSLRQARKLREFGLRDDLAHAEAQRVIDAIAANRWRVPSWLLSDPRYRVERVA
jgi:hypothetical protein